MKRTLQITTALTISMSVALAQQSAIICQQAPSLRLQSPACVKPTDAKVQSTSCTELRVQWQGSSDQTYEVTAIRNNPALAKTSSVVTQEFTCDGDGICSSIIPVEAGTKVTWSVQAKCITSFHTNYSYQLRGGTADIPFCNQVASGSITNVFPNPSTGNLTVAYVSPGSGDVQFTVYDLFGKRVFTQLEQAVAGVSLSFPLQLQNLPSGVYMLEARNGNEVSQRKFVIEK